MCDQMESAIKKYSRINRLKKFFRRALYVLGCTVAFVTTYALILPAITMEKESFCGLEEHVHAENCYAQRIELRNLVCSPENIVIHQHNDACYNASDVLNCGQADYLVHCHTDDCWDADGALVCKFEERSQHAHGSGCYQQPEPIFHIHTETCNILVKGDLTCTQQEREGHTHEAVCYQPGDVLECAIPAGHTHTDDCYANQLICSALTDPHMHSDSCYVSGKQLCSIHENHIHSENCLEKSIICGQEGPEHIHEESCYATQINCVIPEGHTHSSNCFERILNCGKSEGEMHEHVDSCYSVDRILLCNLEENHSHNTDCYNQEMICSTLESEGHMHGDTCYQWNMVLGCGLDEGEQENLEAEPELICTEPVATEHVHDDRCFEIVMQDAPAVCNVEHEHSYNCYALCCSLEEHTHSLQCYSNPDADVEVRQTWETSMRYLELTEDWHANVVAVAESQLGYTESSGNYVVWEDNSVHGYTRYGAWYGIPHGDWCGMFASFCLEYAGVEGMPYNYGVRPWIEDLSSPELNLYRTAEEHSPIPGELVFFDWEEDGLSDHVGIVYEISEATEAESAKLKTIEGNSSNCVQIVTYDLNDKVILGYSMLPENPEDVEKILYCGFVEHTHQKTVCYGEDDALLCALAEHIHDENCTIEPSYFCTMTSHTHGDDCYGADGILICQQTEHSHTESCMQEVIEYFCNMEEHTHDDSCYDPEGMLICEIEEHLHEEACCQEPPLYYCGIEDHVHSSLCLVDLQDLEELSRERVEKVIQMIDEIPSADEIDAKIAEYEDAEQYEEEELWLTEIYQKIAAVYSEYAGLDEDLRERVINRDKLLELEYIWSIMPLATYYIWLDGTDGGIQSLGGSDNKVYTVTNGTFTLPTEWPTPVKYSYTLRGWYDITNYKYYAPGSSVEITGNTVFYADWVASTYDVGQNNSHVVNTVSTNDFITTHIFDYGALFNLYSTSYTGSINQSSHSESWSLVSSGTVKHNDATTLAYIFRDWNDDKKISYPSGSDGKNTSQSTITSGLYDPNLINLFFGTGNSFNPATGEGVLGKQYLGTADHLFQYDSDPDSEYHGYYYYDSTKNAASYNQSARRFYVYDYLERTTDSKKDKGLGEYSDFLPFNSPYANTNGKKLNTYTYNGTTNYEYDAKYNTTENSVATSPNNVGTNYWFGMSTNIRFYLPNKPDPKATDDPPNQSIYGDDMVFSFSGDDDVWVLVDGKVVLDIGGMHGVKSGTIDFSLGSVVVEGTEQTEKAAIIQALEPGEHTLTVYYMERGSSQSNCSIYFNISPRFMLNVQKEDFMKNELLDGAEFSVYLDEDCTEPAELWTDYAAYVANEKATNSFVVMDGTASIWGFAAGNTYYIRETKAPDGNYIVPNGLIKMELSNKGVAHYTAEVVEDPKATNPDIGNPTPGFAVKGFRVDEETHEAYLIVNNSLIAGETKDILVQKNWEGSQTASVTVYLLADGVRIREASLYSGNSWKHVWTSLPVYREDGTEIVYTVEEVPVAGYTASVETADKYVTTTVDWSTSGSFSTGNVYLLKTSAGYLALSGSSLTWVTEAEAKASEAAQWTAASVSGSTVSLKNGDGYYLSYYSNKKENYFCAGTDQKTVTFEDNYLQFGVRDGKNTTIYYMTTTTYNSGGMTASRNSKATFTLYQKSETSVEEEFEGIIYLVTNTEIPEDNQTSFTVTKQWTERDGVTAYADTSDYEQMNVTVNLLANGVKTGHTGVLNLKNGWTYTFGGILLNDSSGNAIQYSVEEVLDTEDWTPQYVKTNDNAVQINNVYSRVIRIPVEKRWEYTIANADQEAVTIELYSAPAEEKEATLVATVTLDASNQWKGEFVVPPMDDSLRYFLYESTDRFAAVYENTSTIFINGAAHKASPVTVNEETGEADTQIITNYAIEELPETGGRGTVVYSVLGLLLTMTALWMLFEEKIKAKRENSPDRSS